MQRNLGVVWLMVGAYLSIDVGTCAELEIDEPVFGFSYFASQANFQRIQTQALGAACIDQARQYFFPKGKFERQLYLYGSYDGGDTRLRIVGDTGGTSIFVQRGAVCTVAPVVVAFEQLRHNPPVRTDPPVLSQTEIEAVFADLLQRYEAAFASKAQFFAWLDPLTEQAMAQCAGISESYCHPTWHILPKGLQAMLARFRGAP